MRAPAHVHLAVRILDRCGADDAFVGDLLEMYEARPSALRLWGEVAGAVAGRWVSHARENMPQTIRRAATLSAALGLLVYVGAGSTHVDLATSVKVEDVSAGWVETGPSNGMTKILPMVTFHLRNVSGSPLTSVQVNVLFRREGDNHAWSDVFRRAITNRPLESGTSTAAIVATAPVGYTSSEVSSRLLRHSRFVDAAAAIYARHGSDSWTYLGEYPLPRQIVGRRVDGRAERRAASFRIR